MHGNTIMKALAVASLGVLLAGCEDEPTSPEPRATQLASGDVIPADPPPAFLIRGTLDAFFINQAPDMMIRSNAAADFVIQRLVTDPGPGSWHKHPGPSIGIVEQGRVMITRYTKKDGCVSTIYGPGEPAGTTYIEEAHEVHQPTVLGPDVAVEYKARFFWPIGGSYTETVDDPCS